MITAWRRNSEGGAWNSACPSLCDVDNISGKLFAQGRWQCKTRHHRNAVLDRGRTLLQPGVKAPGTANKIPRFPAKSDRSDTSTGLPKLT